MKQRYTVADFRTNLKGALDTALNGTPIIILRGDETFVLVHDDHKGATNDDILAAINELKNVLPYKPFIKVDTGIYDDPEKNNFEVQAPNKELSERPLTPDPGSYEEGLALVRGRKIAGNSFTIAEELPCCKGNSPCRHWEFNGEVWRNTISGRKREAE